MSCTGNCLPKQGLLCVFLRAFFSIAPPRDYPLQCWNMIDRVQIFGRRTDRQRGLKFVIDYDAYFKNSGETLRFDYKQWKEAISCVFKLVSLLER